MEERGREGDCFLQASEPFGMQRTRAGVLESSFGVQGLRSNLSLVFVLQSFAQIFLLGLRVHG